MSELKDEQNNEIYPFEPENDGVYPVGYKKPPMHTRFQPGKSGNPKGRPKKKPISTIDLFMEELRRKVSVKSEQGIEKLSAIKVYFRRLMKDGMEGKPTAVKIIAQMLKHKDYMNQESLTPTVTVVLARDTEDNYAAKTDILPN